MSEVYDVIIQPIVSEKSARQMEAGNIYTFKVAGHANKIDIARAGREVVRRDRIERSHHELCGQSAAGLDGANDQEPSPW